MRHGGGGYGGGGGSVSIHASVKDATEFDGIRWCYIVVSIHASVKDATNLMTTLDVLKGFNPRICKRCDHLQLPRSARNRVSIHASVKDATLARLRDSGQIGVSIHASVKDATII